MKKNRFHSALMIGCTLALGALAACGSGKEKQYEIHLDKSSPALKVSVKAPDGLKEEIDASGAPTFKPSGNKFMPSFAIVALDITGDDPQAKMDKAISRQFGTDPVTRVDKGEGRVWIQQVNDAKVTHARMFVPTAQGVVMCVVFLGEDDASRLPEFQGACEGMKVIP